MFQPMLIAGKWVPARSGRVLDVENPATKTNFAQIPRGQADDIEAAVDAAAKAFVTWRRIPAAERGQKLLDISRDIQAHEEDLAKAIASETGNALRTQSRPEAQEATRIFRYFGGLVGEIKGETLSISEELFSYNRREPIGVVGAIIPWNTPVELAALKIAPALCAGNTVVLKPAEDAPLSVLMLAKICEKHLPPGVLNIVTGLGEEVGAALACHPLVRTISFTGSTEIGQLIMRSAATRTAPVALELGGKSPSIVFPDVDQDWAAKGSVSAMRFTRQSQSCTAGSRLFVHRSIFESFLEKVIKHIKAFKIGDPLNEQTDVGSLINKKQFSRVCDFVSDGISSEKAKLRFGGLPPTDGPLSEGYFAIPTVFSSDSNDWRLAREEIFGPVLIAIPWEDEAEVVRMANDSHYGLAAFVWSQNIDSAIRVAHAVEAGWVQVNQGGGQVLGQSYGGVKQSGIGRECSLEGMLDALTIRKNVTINLSPKV